MSGPFAMLATMRALRPAWVWGIGAAVALIVVAAIVVTTMVMQQARDQRFLNALDADATTTVGELPDEQLLVSRQGYCEDIARGWDVEDAVAASEENWREGGEVSKLEYEANVRALFNAASVAC